ncbi:hypothetical protein P43SY_003605 [Pythium insidiosum]|uniref:UDP-sugar transporter n=1 Tax=Pythium insidiosum TaxID=114742 RepID=A0AAD5LLS1_PYTIN|nr:hypothetical protein P43SY_003605 [Pythium insidiosum]
MRKMLRTIAGMLASATLLCAGNLCINASKRDGEIPYISVTVTFLIEVLKLIVCLVAIVVMKVPPPSGLSTTEAAFYAVPSLLYMIDNNLTYIILRYIDPATLSVLWNLKILVTAVLFRFVLKRRLTDIRKIAILLLLLGVVTSQSDHLNGHQQHAVTKHGTNATTTATGHAASSSPGSNPQDFMLATILLLIAVTISSCASVFTEWAFKRKGACPFLWQNALLYVFGIVFNGIGLMVESNNLSSRGFFSGYNGWTFAVIFVNCIGGISVGFILKFLDNIACVYAHAVAMMLTMLFSMLFFKFSPSLEFVCGLSVLLISMYLYHHQVEGATAPSRAHCNGEDDDADSDTEDSLSSSSSHKESPSTMMSLSAAGLHATKKHYERVANTSPHHQSPADMELGRLRTANSEPDD